MSNHQHQRRLRFQMRAFIACWILAYGLLRQEAFLLDVYQTYTPHWPKMAFLWLVALVTFLPLAGLHWWLTREPEEPEADSWREIS